MEGGRGKLLETAFAPGHYFAMFFVNVAGLTGRAFMKKDKRRMQETDGGAQGVPVAH